MATTTSSAGTTNPGGCSTSSTGSCSLPMPDSADSSRRSLSDAGRKRLSSFPSRQRRMGPAPLASFEDLSMDKTTSDSSPEERTQLPDIGEETSTATTPVTPVAKTALSVPASPRIRVSAASSSSPHETDSKESTPEKELFSGYAKAGFCEDMAADLHSSTEELDADEEDRQRKRRDRACKLAEIERREEALRTAELNRKGSSSSVLSDGLLPVTSGHSSRLSSLGSIGSARRSPSPHKMLLETSFCGSRPIQQPSIDLEDPPVTTTKIMNYTIEKIERVKSPMEARPPDIFRSSPSTVLPLRQEDLVMAVGAIPVSELQMEPPQKLMDVPPPKKRAEARTESKTLDAARDVPADTAIPKSPREQKSTQPPKSPHVVQDSHQAHHEKHFADQNQLEPQQQRQPLSSPRSPRSPRMPKKVPVPQVPDLKDLPKTSPTPSAASAAAATATTPEHPSARSYSTTPTASPRSRRRRTRAEEFESGTSSPSLSRKSSFSNLFRKSDAIMSPVTPDSPGSSGRKSPFSQFIKSAKKEFRSRSRSRSRSKSRERDLDDDTHDRRGVLSIFRPKTKKKSDSEKLSKSNERLSSTSDAKMNEAITNVEFTFNDDGKYQPSSFGLIRQESEVCRAIKEPLRGVPPPREGEPEVPKDMISSRDSSYNELSTIMSPDGKSVPAEKVATPDAKEVLKDKRDQMGDDDVFEKAAEIQSSLPSPPPSPPAESVQREDRETTQVDKPHLPPKQKDRSELELTVDQHDADSRSESERESEIEYLKTKAKIQQAAETGVPIDSPDVENKGLVSQDSGEDGELPYVPTTLPTERPLAAPIIPVKERPPQLRSTQSIDRPRSTAPLITGRLEEYKQVAGTPEGDAEKMMINIPQTGPVKVLPTKSPKRQTSKSWEDFCQEGLRSPRQLRKQFRESRKKTSEDDVPPPLPPKVRSPIRSPVTQPPEPYAQKSKSTGGTPEGPRSWINFDEMPEIVLKPVRQIKTVPPRHASQQKQEQREAQVLEKWEPQRQTEIQPQDWQESRFQDDRMPLQEEPRRLPPPLPAPLNHDFRDSDSVRTPSEASTPDKADSSDRSSDSDKPTSPSSSEDLTVRERLEEIKKEADDYENSDLERLLAPVNECINRLSSLSSEPAAMERRSPIPDNWADFLLPPQPGRRSRLSSLGSDAGSVGGRSPSPSCMLLETSFCGSAPIDDPASVEPDVPIPIARKLSGVSLGDLCPFTSRERSPGLIPCADRTSILSDSSAEGGGSPRESDYYTRHQTEPQRSQPGAGRQLNPFGMDLGVRSNRSSVVSQDQVPR